MATVADFYEALNHYVADAEKLRLIVQGDETTVVSTMFGPIDSVAKTIAEIEAEINAAGTGWLALAEAAADDAQSSANDAVAAAMASGIDAFANTYADAQTAAGSLQVGDSIMIFTDENASNSLTVRLVESGPTLSEVKANFTEASPLLSSTAPGEGASLVKYQNGLTVQQWLPVDNVKALCDATYLQVPGVQVEVAGFYRAGDGGKKRAYWDATRDKATADGGAVTDPGALNGFDGTPTTLHTTYYDETNGQGSGTGVGCWVMVDTHYNLAQWGYSTLAHWRGNRYALGGFSGFAFSVGGASATVDPGVYELKNSNGVLRGGTHLRGTPRATVFKKPDALPDELESELKFDKVLAWNSGSYSDDEIRMGASVYGIDIDGNRDNQNWTGGYSQQQAHNLQANISSSPNGVRFPFTVENVHIYNSVADGCNINTNIDAHLSNIKGVDCFRGVIVPTGGNSRIVMSDIDADESGFDIEIEATGPVTILADNLTSTGLFELNIQEDSYVSISNSQLLGNLDLNASGTSEIVFNGGRIEQDENTKQWIGYGNVTLNGTTIVAKRSAAAVGDVLIYAISPRPNSNFTAYTGQRARFNNCTWQTSGTLPGDTVVAIRHWTVRTGEGNSVIVNGGECSNGYDTFLDNNQGADCYVGGGLRCNAARFITLNSLSGFDLNVDIGAVYLGPNVQTYADINNLRAADRLVHHDTRIPESSNVITSSAGLTNDNSFTTGRRIIVGLSDPTTTNTPGLRGDIYENNAPTAGSNYQWVCTQTDDVSAVWKLLTTMAA